MEVLDLGIAWNKENIDKLVEKSVKNFFRNEMGR